MENYITSNEIALMKVSLFDSCTVSSKYTDVSLVNFLCGDLNKAFSKRVEELRVLCPTEKQKQYKNTKLCAATLSCTFNTRRSSDDIMHINPLVVIDIDSQDNPGNDFRSLKMELFKLDYVYCVSKSCRGNGLFCIIPIADPTQIKAYHKHICDTLEKQFSIKIDRACSDVTRLRIISHDDNILIKNNTRIKVYTQYDDSLIKKPNSKQNNFTSNKKIINSNETIFDVACVHYLIYQLNFHTDDEPTWFKACMALTTLDFQWENEQSLGFSLFMCLSLISDKYDERAVKMKWKSCIKRKNEHTSMAFFYSLLKQKLGNSWRFTIRQYINNNFKVI